MTDWTIGRGCHGKQVWEAVWSVIMVIVTSNLCAGRTISRNVAYFRQNPGIPKVHKVPLKGWGDITRVTDIKVKWGQRKKLK